MDRLSHNQMSYSDSLKATLNCYRLSSMDSLGGPSGCSAVAAQMWFKENKQSPPLPPPPQLVQIPLLMPKDTSSQRSETVIGGKKISCFIVGGEKRLCLPQILTTVFKNYSLSEINRACAELHIYCSRCSPDQLEILKVLGVLPFNTTQCGLITKSDAERLMTSLGVERVGDQKRDFFTERSNGIPVYHECFGTGEGVFYPDLYVTPDAPCITCEDCRMKLSPAKFVAHSHRGLEKRTCHWGFDRENWRYYILIPDHLEEREYLEMETRLKRVKEKFSSSGNDETNHRRSPNNLKRKIKLDQEEFEDSKRMKAEKTETHHAPPSTASYPRFPITPRASAFKPWPPSLHPPFHYNTSPLHNNEALLKILAPLMREGALLPHFLPYPSPGLIPPILSQPATLPTSTSSFSAGMDWLSSAKSPHKVPNITLDPADQQKRAEDFALMKHRLKEETLKRRQAPHNHAGPHLWNQQKNRIPVKTEVAETPFVTLVPRGVNGHNGEIEFESSFLPRTYPIEDERRLKKSTPGNYQIQPSNSVSNNAAPHSHKLRRHRDPRPSEIQYHRDVESPKPLHSKTADLSEIQNHKTKYSSENRLYSSPNLSENSSEIRKRDEEFRDIRHYKTADSSEIRNHQAADSVEINNHIDENSTKTRHLNDNVLSDVRKIEDDDEENEIIDVTGDGDQPDKHVPEKNHSDSPRSSEPSPSSSEPPQCSSEPSNIVPTTTLPSSASPVLTKHTNIHSPNSFSSTQVLFPMVTPIDSLRSQYKWDFPSASYILSSPGSNELRRLQSSLEDNCDGKKRSEIVHSMVKMRWSLEEKLAMKTKALNDVKEELNRTRTLREKEREEFLSASKQSRDEMERMSNNFHARMKDARESLLDSGRKLAGEDEMHQKILERLRTHGEQQEEAIRKLEQELMEERNRRLRVEKKLEEIVEDSREKMFSFVSGPILPNSRPLQKCTVAGEVGDLVPCADGKSPLAQEEEAASDDEAIDMEENLPTLRPHSSSPSHSSSKDSGVHDV